MRRDRKTTTNTIWVDVGDSVHRGALGILKHYLVRSLKTLPNSFLSAMEVEAWARVV